MKTLHKLFVLLLLSALALAFPASALAAGPETDGNPDKIVFGGDFTLESGDTLEEGLVVFGGSVVIEQRATVTGDVAVMGGSLQCDGLIEGNVLVMGGQVDLGETAVVEKDVVSLGGTFNRAPGARIDGDIVAELPEGVDFPSTGPWVFPFFAKGYVVDNLNTGYIPPVWDGLWFLWVPFATLMMAALAMMIMLFWPQPIERMAKAVVSQPLISGGMGCLTILVLPFALVIMAVSILLIPAIPILIIVLGLAIVLGWVAIGLEVGKRIALAFNRDWHPALSIGLGTLLITFVAVGIDKVVPCAGWIIPTVIGLVALGTALLTRFGTVDYPAPVPPVTELPKVVAGLPEAETVETVEAEPVVAAPEELPKPKRPARKAKTPKTE